MTLDEALHISQAVAVENGEAEANLRAKCRWESQSRTAVIMEWGDPRKWDSPGVRLDKTHIISNFRSLRNREW